MLNYTSIHNKEKFLEVFGNEDNIINQITVYEDAQLEDLTITSKITILSTRFYNTFKRCKFSDVSFDKLTASHATFEDCVFDNCSFFDSTFEYTKFKNCTFKNMTMTGKYIVNTSFEDCTFDTTRMASFSFDANQTIFNNCKYVAKHLQSLILKNVIFHNGRIVSKDEDLKNIAFVSVIHFSGNNVFPLIYGIGPIGSRGDTTYYIPSIDWVKCGCWTNAPGTGISGGSLEDFEKRVLKTHSRPEGLYHGQYMAAIAFFKEMKNIYLKHNKEVKRND